jgi:homocysteine S-methyltransferase
VGKDNKYVAVSLGCYGAALADGSEYRGDYQVSDAELTRFHKDRLETALQESPDAIAFETIPQALEVEQVARLLLMMKEPAMDSVATWISVSCRNGSDLNDGTPLTNVLQRLRHVDPDGRHVHGIGINCCAGQHIASLLQIIAKDMAIHGPQRVILVYPNSGEEFDAVANDWKEGSGCATALEFAAMMRQGLRAVEETWTQHGDGPLPKMVVGGCCRTSPATIAALRTVLEERLHSR